MARLESDRRTNDGRTGLEKRTDIQFAASYGHNVRRRPRFGPVRGFPHTPPATISRFPYENVFYVRSDGAKYGIKPSERFTARSLIALNA